MGDIAQLEQQVGQAKTSENKQNPSLIPVKQTDGSIVFNNAEGKPVYGYEKGELGITLPSGEKTNVCYDSRISGQAEYSSIGESFVFSPSAVKEINHPEKYPTEGWSSSEQRINYILRHEYNHFVWNRLGEDRKEQIITLFSKPEYNGTVRSFAAVLISKPEYQLQEEKDFSVPCYEFAFGGIIHRYSKDKIIGELLGHAVIGEIMDRDGITKIQRANPERENFGGRSKWSIDCIGLIKKSSPEDYEVLINSGVVNNQDFDKDCETIKSMASDFTQPTN